jgi:hypothetical protein
VSDSKDELVDVVFVTDSKPPKGSTTIRLGLKKIAELNNCSCGSQAEIKMWISGWIVMCPKGCFWTLAADLDDAIALWNAPR